MSIPLILNWELSPNGYCSVPNLVNVIFYLLKSEITHVNNVQNDSWTVCSNYITLIRNSVYRGTDGADSGSVSLPCFTGKIMMVVLGRWNQ